MLAEKLNQTSDFLIGVELVSIRGSMAERSAVKARTFANQLVEFPRVDWISITDNAGGSPQHVSLAGSGIGPMATLNPTSLSFGNQSVNTTSGAKGMEVKNTGSNTLTISSIAIGGTNATDFSQTNNCPGSLLPGAHCNVSVSFSPTGIGTRTAFLNVSSNASNGPQLASLTGTGQ